MRLGVDVGGTHTDAVVMRGAEILGSIKTGTTAPITQGILAAIDGAISAAGAAPRAISAIILGTTQFTNAVVERRHLLPVGVVRAGLPSGRDLPPFSDWPDDLKAITKAASLQVGGGVLFDGEALAPLTDDEVMGACQAVRSSGAKSAAVSSVFSPLNDQDEARLKAALCSILPDRDIVRSSDVGALGLLERENAAILNAALLGFAQDVTKAISAALQARELTCPFFLTQNDGTLMDMQTAARFPARTFASGPTNSLRGAALLSGMRDAIVIDIGGTTSDVGVLKNGFARQSNTGVSIGGVRTNFRMPDILAIGLGGGSLVSSDGRQVGPKSVGYELPHKGRVFGGDVLTATDIAVQDGALDIANGPGPSLCDVETTQTAAERIHTLLDDAIARMCGRDKKPVILVGGGAILVTRDLHQAADVIRPPHGDVANAVGASIAQAAGVVDTIVGYRDTPRDQALQDAKATAKAKALANGASEESITILDVEEVPFSYTDNQATRLRVKAVGDLDFARLGP